MGFLIVTCRRLVREKFHTILSILSLALGMTSALLISLYLYSELTFDHHHENHNDIFRIKTTIGDISGAMSGYEVGSILVREYPQFIDFVRIREAHEQRFEFGANSNNWDFAMLADPAIFEVFTFNSISGDMATALSDPYSVAISESFASYYFGDRDPVGELISTDELEFRVTLVFADLPENVSQQIDALLPMQLMKFYEPEYLDGLNRYIDDAATYLLTTDQFDPSIMTEISDQFFDTYVQEILLAILGDLGEADFSFELQKLSEIHFGEPVIGDETTESVLNISIFSAIAIAVLIISCINYINLATARAAIRSKEVAMRKILGAEKQKLILQFVTESFVLIGIAFILALTLAILVNQLGLVATISGKTELTQVLLTPEILMSFFAISLLVALLTGLYPAITLSRHSMMAIFRPSQGGWQRGLRFRQLLVFVQMSLAMIIITSVFIMLRQTDFLLNSPLGFKKENQVVVNLQGADTIRSRNTIITELMQHSEISSVVESFDALGRGLSISVMTVEDNNGEDQLTTTHPMRFGTNVLDALEIELLDGIHFTEERAESDINPVLVNETLVSHMGWDQAIGRRVGRGEVIGVVRDFHYLPLHEPIAPVWIAPFADGYLDNLQGRQLANVDIALTISTTGNRQTEVEEFIYEVVDNFSEQAIIEIFSLEDVWNEMYDDDTRTMRLVGFFAGISIIISIMGLAGLTAYSNQQRTKEIAMRKVLGASVPSLLVTLGTSTLIVIVLAAIPAAILAFTGSETWLERFAYRADFSVSPFLYGFIATAFFSLTVLCAQTYRTSLSNPVTNLRHE